jgi:hypothetical protein
MPLEPPVKEGLQTRIIKKPRVIVGLLGEIDASEVLVMFASTQSNASFTAKVSTEFRVPFEESTLSIRDQKPMPDRYIASAFFAGQRVTFETDVIDSQGNCSLPSEITIHDLRQRKRRRFGPEIEFAEISTAHGILMASPVDMSQSSIALLINSRDGSLLKGEIVRLVIRGDTTGRDIYSAEMIVQNFRQGSGQGKVLLGPVQMLQPRDNYRPRGVRRRALSGFNLGLCPMDDNLGEPIQFSLSDVSMTGFSGESALANDASWVTPGMSARIQQSNLTATVVWKDGVRFGFRLDCLDEPNSLSEWARILSSLTKSNDYHHSQVEELVTLFTESGLLKGKRRHLYGTSPGGYLPPERMTENPLLYRRVSFRTSDHRTEGHLSLVRLTDDLWFAQEGAYVGSSKNGYRELVATTVLHTRDILKSTRSGPRYFAGLFSGDLASASAAYSKDFFSDPTCRVYSLFQGGIKALAESANSNGDTQKITEVFDLSADHRAQAFTKFDSTLAETFGGWNGSHPRLNAELAKFGPHHEARTMLVSDESNGTWGMAYRLRSYYALSVSGVMNSLFFIVRPTVSMEVIAEGIRSLANTGFCFGTDDVAIIADPGKASSEKFSIDMRGVKPFTFFILDNHLHREYLGGPIEDGSAIAYRNRKK